MKALRNKITAALLALAVLTLTIIACGGGNGSETAVPSATSTPEAQSDAGSQPGIPTSIPITPIPTPTSTPSEPTPEPTDEAPRVKTKAPGEPDRGNPTPTPEAKPGNNPELYSMPDCINAMIDGFKDWHEKSEGFKSKGFSPGRAQKILDQITETNDDCRKNRIQAKVTANGESHCKGPGSTRMLGNIASSKYRDWRLPTQFQDTTMGKGDYNTLKMHLNFDIMPIANAPGCWLYDQGDLFWRIADTEGDVPNWRPNGEGHIPDVDIGRYNHYNPECDRETRRQIEQKAGSPQGFKADSVATIITQIQGTKTCSESIDYQPIWGMTPQAEPAEGCGTRQETGIKENQIVINWNWEKNQERKPGDGSVCWIAERNDENSNEWSWTRYNEDGKETKIHD